MQRSQCSKRDKISKSNPMQVCTIHFTAETELSMRFRAEKRWRSWLKSSFPKSGLNQNIVVLTAKLQYCVQQTVIKVMNTQSYCRIARRRYNITCNQFVWKDRFKLDDWKTMMQYVKKGGNICNFDLKSSYHHLDLFQSHQPYTGFSFLVEGRVRYFFFTVSD